MMGCVSKLAACSWASQAGSRGGGTLRNRLGSMVVLAGRKFVIASVDVDYEERNKVTNSMSFLLSANMLS